MKYVFDACALIAFLNAEAGGEHVDNLLTRAADGEHTCSMHKINLIEVFYGYIRDHGLDGAIRIMEPVYELPLQCIETIRACLRSRILALQTPKFYLAGSKMSRKSGFLRSIGRKNPHFKQALSDEIYRAAAFLKGTYHISLGDSIACASEPT
jgi:hypothetical protein